MRDFSECVMVIVILSHRAMFETAKTTVMLVVHDNIVQGVTEDAQLSEANAIFLKPHFVPKPQLEALHCMATEISNNGNRKRTWVGTGHDEVADDLSHRVCDSLFHISRL